MILQNELSLSQRVLDGGRPGPPSPARGGGVVLARRDRPRADSDHTRGFLDTI
jgi:hypothetical protein